MSITDGETLRLEGIIQKLQAKSECDDALLIAMSEKCEKLKAERDAAIADAKRYQWLMQNCGFGIRRNGVHELTVAFYQNQPDCIADLDKAIDAAMEAEHDNS